MSQDTNGTKQRPSVGFIDIALLVCAWFFIELLLFRGPTPGHSKAQQLVQAAEPAEVAEAAEAPPKPDKRLNHVQLFHHSDISWLEHQMNTELKRLHVLVDEIEVSAANVETVAVIRCPLKPTEGSYTQVKICAGDPSDVDNQIKKWTNQQEIAAGNLALTTSDTRTICIVAYTVQDK